jgi:hypothetical protein
VLSQLDLKQNLGMFLNAPRKSKKGPQDSRCVDGEMSGQLHAPAALPLEVPNAYPKMNIIVVLTLFLV